MKLKEIAKAVNGTIPSGTEELEVNCISSLENCESKSITFITKKGMAESASKSGATAVLTRDGWSVEGIANIVVADPYWAYAQLAQLFEDSAPIFGSNISESAIVDSSSNLGKNVTIGPGSIIGANVTVGDNVKIDARVVIEKNVKIGDNSHIHSGAVIRYGVTCGERNIISSGAILGSEGFANGFNGKDFLRIPCFGTVVLEDDVEIGANTTIDRGNFENTIIRKGARIDNLIMIAHNVEIGESCGIAAQVGFAGSTTLGKRVMIAGQAGFGGHITIGDDSFVGGQAGIQASFPEKSKITGSPAIDLMRRRRIDTAETKLPDALRELKKLRKELDEIKENLKVDK
jgi:UDP-3-O-[3-hydroxymyristoyl] glucosamine N-acyltransferase